MNRPSIVAVICCTNSILLFPLQSRRCSEGEERKEAGALTRGLFPGTIAMRQLCYL